MGISVWLSTSRTRLSLARNCCLRSWDITLVLWDIWRSIPTSMCLTTNLNCWYIFWLVSTTICWGRSCLRTNSARSISITWCSAGDLPMDTTISLSLHQITRFMSICQRPIWWSTSGLLMESRSQKSHTPALRKVDHLWLRNIGQEGGVLRGRADQVAKTKGIRRECGGPQPNPRGRAQVQEDPQHFKEKVLSAEEEGEEHRTAIHASPRSLQEKGGQRRRAFEVVPKWEEGQEGSQLWGS